MPRSCRAGGGSPSSRTPCARPSGCGFSSTGPLRASSRYGGAIRLWSLSLSGGAHFARCGASPRRCSSGAAGAERPSRWSPPRPRSRASRAGGCALVHWRRRCFAGSCARSGSSPPTPSRCDSCDDGQPRGRCGRCECGARCATKRAPRRPCRGRWRAPSPCGRGPGAPGRLARILCSLAGRSPSGWRSRCSGGGAAGRACTSSSRHGWRCSWRAGCST